LQELTAVVQQQSQQLLQLVQQLLLSSQPCSPHSITVVTSLPMRHRTAVSSILLSTAPLSVTGASERCPLPVPALLPAACVCAARQLVAGA
jgi:hypothetical protein